MDDDEAGGGEKPLNLLRIFLPDDDSELENSGFSFDYDEIEKEAYRLFPPVEPQATPDGTDEDSIQALLSRLSLVTQLESCSRIEARLAEAYQGVHTASKMLEPLMDKAETCSKLFNKACRSTPYQAVVLKTVEIDEDGVLRTVNNSKNEKNETVEAENIPNIPSTSDVATDTDTKVVDEETSRRKAKVETRATSDDFGIESDDEVSAIGEVKPDAAVYGDKPGAGYSVAPTPRILPRMVPAVNKKVYAMRGSSLSHWVPARVIRIDRNPKTSAQQFHVELEPSGGRKGNKEKEIRAMDAKHLAFSLKTPFLLPVGARVIGRFKDELNQNIPVDHDFYAGIVAERPIPHNQNRYLIFFDDGYAQYVAVENVLWVCESSKDVWNDVHPSSQSFIKDYLKKYPERPMVRLSKGTIVSTEWNGNWWIGRVVDVDCSLVKIHFEADNRYEWIYRGSTRLAPLYNKLRRQAARGLGVENGDKSPTTARRRHDVHAASHLKEAKIEYLNINTTSSPGKNSQTARKSTAVPPRSRAISPPSPPPQMFSHPNVNPLANTAKKPPGTNSSTGLLEYEGRMTRIVIPKNVEGPLPYAPHACKPVCVRFYNDNDPETKMINPLSLPMYYGFAREIGKNPRRSIFYRAPCGRRIRDYEELHEYLKLTRYNMGIDHFCFDYAVDCFSEFVPTSNHFIINDITYGKEKVPVQCCNSVDHEYPEYVEYTKDRQPAQDVHMNLDADFLSCCDCKDDCADKDNCACWKMTMEGMNKARLETTLEVGYQNRRLMDHCITGIYECNRRCQCRKTCLNRVVQFDMKWQLQIFKTSNKGWAIRPIHDIPQGAFICVYAGQLLTDQGANEDGKAFGDEYLAELDYIEVCEAYKEGFEADVVEPEPQRRKRRHSSRDSTEIYDEEDEDYKVDGNCSVDNGGNNSYSLRGTKRNQKGEGAPNGDAKEKKSLRELFGSDEYCYIMDAKSSGNIGRYLNHSCQPNVFVQNVFVDTHDLRFPWVAFFAYKHIRAGTELTWDYNYDIGSVPGKTMYCYCGTPECRGRLL